MGKTVAWVAAPTRRHLFNLGGRQTGHDWSLEDDRRILGDGRPRRRPTPRVGPRQQASGDRHAVAASRRGVRDAGGPDGAGVPRTPIDQCHHRRDPRVMFQ